MFRSKADRLLDEMIRENRLAEGDENAHATARRSLFGTSRQSDERLTQEQEAKRRDRRSDLTVAALGVTLGLICALFPWYIFFNPDEFGVRAMRFGGGGNGTEPILLGAQTDRMGAPAESREVPLLDLDLRSTGSAIKEPDAETGSQPPPGIAEQPFPAPIVAFRVVQIANGRAMLEDDTGFFIVQPGSVLPDGDVVRMIGDSNGKPVLATEGGEVLELSE